jgi:quinol monooxygenase YgiN
MKHITLLLLAGITLCFFSCTSGGQDQAEDNLANATPFKLITVQHTVKDFAAFKVVYDSHDSMRQASGVTNFVMGRGLDNPNLVIVMNKISDTQKAKDFAASPDLKTAMDSAGVTDAPLISFVNVFRNDTSTITQTERLMVSHRVKDFDAWFKVYQAEGKAKRAENGLVERGMARDIDDPNRVTVVFAITDMVKAKARVGSEELKKLMTDAGVEGPPQIVFYKLLN